MRSIQRLLSKPTGATGGRVRYPAATTRLRRVLAILAPCVAAALPLAERTAAAGQTSSSSGRTATKA